MAEQTNSDNLQPSTRMVDVYLRRSPRFAAPVAAVPLSRARELVWGSKARWINRAKAVRLTVDVLADAA